MCVNDVLTCSLELHSSIISTFLRENKDSWSLFVQARYYIRRENINSENGIYQKIQQCHMSHISRMSFFNQV